MFIGKDGQKNYYLQTSPYCLLFKLTQSKLLTIKEMYLYYKIKLMMFVLGVTKVFVY